MRAVWTLEYGSRTPLLFQITASDAASGWLLSHASSMLKVSVNMSTGLMVRVDSVSFRCILSPGPAAVIISSPSGLLRPGAKVDLRNCSFSYGHEYGVFLQGSVLFSSLLSDYDVLARGALFCVGNSNASIDLPLDEVNESVACVNCRLRVQGEPQRCTMPTTAPPPVPPEFYTACDVLPPPTPPPPRPPHAPPTPPPPQSRLMLLLLASSAVVGAGLVALIVAAIMRARVTRVVISSTTVDSPQDVVVPDTRQDFL